MIVKNKLKIIIYVSVAAVILVIAAFSARAIMKADKPEESAIPQGLTFEEHRDFMRKVDPFWRELDDYTQQKIKEKQNIGPLHSAEN